MSDRLYSRKDAVTLIDVLDRILDKGVVIVGDISISLCDIELLSIKLKLLICSIEKARSIGMELGWAGVDKERLNDLERKIQTVEAKFARREEGGE